MTTAVDHWRDAPEITLSVVSHGQGPLVRHLLHDLRGLNDTSFEVLLTVNVPEDLDFLKHFSDLPLRLLHSPVVRGFGANHNAAFAQARGRHFAVVNPDIRMPQPTLRPLLAALQDPAVGACAPEVRAGDGAREDSVRRFPTVMRLLRRVLLRQRNPDYAWDHEAIPVDWVAGMFMVFRSETFASVRGFDERFFMYLEDVDLCRRLHQTGRTVVLEPAVHVVHDAQRASRRSLRHLSWHLRSSWRYFSGS